MEISVKYHHGIDQFRETCSQLELSNDGQSSNFIMLEEFFKINAGLSEEHRKISLGTLRNIKKRFDKHEETHKKLKELIKKIKPNFCIQCQQDEIFSTRLLPPFCAESDFFKAWQTQTWQEGCQKEKICNLSEFPKKAVALVEYFIQYNAVPKSISLDISLWGFCLTHFLSSEYLETMASLIKQTLLSDPDRLFDSVGYYFGTMKNENVGKEILSPLATFLSLFFDQNLNRNIPDTILNVLISSQEDDFACFLLGYCSFFGKGVKKDIQKALSYLIIGSENQFPPVQNLLGFCYTSGLDGEDKKQKGIALLKAAALQGYAAAQNNLAFCLLKGNGTDKDIAEAVFYFQKAARQGYAIAQYHYGYFFHYGIGVKPNLDEAAFWYGEAAKQGNIPAKQVLERLCTPEVGLGFLI